MDALLQDGNTSPNSEIHFVSEDVKPNAESQAACRKLCDDFPDLFAPGLGTLKDVELEIKITDKCPANFQRPRSVPLMLQEDLNKAYEAGVRKGVWKRVPLMNGTPVVPVRKSILPGQSKAYCVYVETMQ